MTIPPLAFQIRGTDSSGPAFKSARRNIGETRRAARAMNADIKAASLSIAGIGKSALIGAAGVGSLVAAVAKLKQGLEQFDRIAKTARQNGLDGEFYQTLAFMAGEASVETAVLDNALRKFTIAVGEARNGAGALYTELRRADEALLDQILNAGSAEERIRIYANAVANAADAEEKAALVKAAFGQRGADLVRVMELGAGAMDQAAIKAGDLGNIIETKVLTQAEEMQNRLGNAADALDKQLNAALIEGAPALIAFYEGLALNVKELRALVSVLPDAFAELERFKTSFRERLGLDALDDFLEGTALLERRIGFASDQKKRSPANDNAGGGFRTGETFGGPNDRVAGAFNVLPSVPASKASRAAILEVVEVFNAERLALVELTGEVDKANQAHRRSASIFRETEGAALDLTTGLQSAGREGAALGSTLQSATSGLVSDILNGVDAMDALKAAGLRVAQQFIEMQLQAALFNRIAGASPKGGGGGGLLGGLFGVFKGFFAEGGMLGAGEWGIAGENGPEPVIGPAQIVSNDNLRKIAGGRAPASGPRAVHVTVDVSGARGSAEIRHAAHQGAMAGYQLAMQDTSENLSSIARQHQKANG
jgi:hypothetical protein